MTNTEPTTIQSKLADVARADTTSDRCVVATIHGDHDGYVVSIDPGAGHIMARSIVSGAAHVAYGDVNAEDYPDVEFRVVDTVGRLTVRPTHGYVECVGFGVDVRPDGDGWVVVSTGPGHVRYAYGASFADGWAIATAIQRADVRANTI